MNTVQKKAQRRSKMEEQYWRMAVESLMAEETLPNYTELGYSAHIFSNGTAARVYRDVAEAIKQALGSCWTADPPRKGNKFNSDLFTMSEMKSMRNSSKLYAQCRDLDCKGYVVAILCSMECRNNKWEIYDSRFAIGRKYHPTDYIEDVIKDSFLEMIDTYFAVSSSNIVYPLDRSNLPTGGMSLKKILIRAGYENFHDFGDEGGNPGIGGQRTVTARLAVINDAFDDLKKDLAKSNIFPKGSRKSGNQKNDTYVEFCVIKHMFKYRPAFTLAGESGRQSVSCQKMVDKVMHRLQKSVVRIR